MTRVKDASKAIKAAQDKPHVCQSHHIGAPQAAFCTSCLTTFTTGVITCRDCGKQTTRSTCNSCIRKLERGQQNKS
jgi:hypothetical protein